MSLIMRLLEILIQATIILAFIYCILSYWGFDTKHFLMLTEGRVPKRVQLYEPPQNHPVDKEKTSSNLEEVLADIQKDKVAENLKPAESTASTTSSTKIIIPEQ